MSQKQVTFAGADPFVAPGSTKLVPLGTQVAFEDGRLFRYVYAPNTIAAMRVVVATPNEHAIASTEIAAAAIGATSVNPTNDCSGITANEYEDGFFFVVESTGAGQQAYVIKPHVAGTTAGITLNLYTPLKAAIAATGTVAKLVSNKYYGVNISTAADPTVQVPLGMSLGAFSSTNCYGWIQTAGITCALADADAIVAGSPVIVAENTNGAVGDQRTATAGDSLAIGIGIIAAASTKYGLIDLRGLDVRVTNA